MNKENYIIAVLVIPFAGIALGSIATLAYSAWSDRKQKIFEKNQKKNGV